VKTSIVNGDGKLKKLQKVISALMNEKIPLPPLGPRQGKTSLILCIKEIDSYVIMFTLYIWIHYLTRNQEVAAYYLDHRRGG
jgi:hypothetical protein